VDLERWKGLNGPGDPKERDVAYPKGRDKIVYPFGWGSCIRRVVVRGWVVYAV